MKRTILQHRRNSVTPRPNFTREFEQWLGRALTPAEKNTFDVLEWVRRYRRDTIRIHITAVNDETIQGTVIDYINFLTELNSLTRIAYSSPCASKAKPYACQRLHTRNVRFCRNNPASVRRMRGDTFDIVYVNNPQDRFIGNIVTALAPAVPAHRPGAAFIVLTTIDWCQTILPYAFYEQYDAFDAYVDLLRCFYCHTRTVVVDLQPHILPFLPRTAADRPLILPFTPPAALAAAVPAA